MMEGDEGLLKCNDSELHWIARIQGLPVLRRDIPREELIAIVSGEAPVTEQLLSGTNYTRRRLENFITANFDRVRGQLPGCDGKCTTFMCSDGKHMSCYLPSEPLLE
jgi:hypothetical protein